MSQKGAGPGVEESGIIIIAASRSFLGRFQTTCSSERSLQKQRAIKGNGQCL